MNKQEALIVPVGFAFARELKEEELSAVSGGVGRSGALTHTPNGPDVQTDNLW